MTKIAPVIPINRTRERQQRSMFLKACQKSVPECKGESFAQLLEKAMKEGI